MRAHPTFRPEALDYKPATDPTAPGTIFWGNGIATTSERITDF
jgi:hypothetical protein